MSAPASSFAAPPALSYTAECPIIAVNRLKATLKAGGTACGTMLAEFRNASTVQMLQNAGFDFVFIDNEHGPLTNETIADLSRFAKTIGLTPIVRVPDHQYTYVSQSLDAGAQGIMFPRVYSLAEAKKCVDMTLYPPQGLRGNALNRGHTTFQGGVDLVSAMKAHNEQTFIIIQAETKECVEDIEAIAALPGVDCILVGPNDLSISLGVPGQYNHELMQKAINRVFKACKDNNKIAALHINDMALMKFWVGKGVRLVSTQSDIECFVKGATLAAQALKDTFKQ